jgi:polyisoprenoid-binding protein YceI
MHLLPALLLAQALFGLRGGELSYTVVHKLHEVKGTTHEIEGRAALGPDGTLKVQVRAKVASFDSGNSNRDEHMREVTHEPLHPMVQVKGTAPGVKIPGQATLHATVDLNGVQKEEEFPVTLAQEGPNIRAKFSFQVSLTDFHIERPELLLVKTDDAMTIDGSLLFGEEKAK